MNAQFHFLTGDRQGQAAIIEESYATLGRHPLCTVAFDGDEDLDVSSRHAAVFREGDLFVLRDLGSTNGTFVNGHQLRADHILTNEDRIQFGHRGPALRVTLIQDESLPYRPATPAPNRFSTIPPRRTEEDPAPPVTDRPDSRQQSAGKSGGFRRIMWPLAVLLAGMALALAWLR